MIVRSQVLQCSLAFGESVIVAHKTRQADDKPFVDHFAVTIDDWNKDEVEAELKRGGLELRPDTENNFVVKDPDGFSLQIRGKDMEL